MAFWQVLEYRFLSTLFRKIFPVCHFFIFLMNEHRQDKKKVDKKIKDPRINLLYLLSLATTFIFCFHIR